MTTWTRWRVALAILAVALGVWQRARAVLELPPDFDELIYLPAAYDYAERMAPGRWGEIPQYQKNLEHPPMVKLLFALGLKAEGAPAPNWDRLEVGHPIPEDAVAPFRTARWLSFAFGVAQLVLLALVEPWAALLLAIEPYHAKYTAQAYLEAVPGLFALLAVLLFERARATVNPSRERTLWAVCALSLGAAAAGKYPYGLVVGLAFLPLCALERRHWRRWLVLALVALAAFFLLDPFLWPAPIARTLESVGFHWNYSHGEHVKEAGLPWWAPLYFLTHAEPLHWHKTVFFTGVVEWIALPLAALGWWRTVRTRPVWASWAAVGLAFLLVWPTKWPQYTLLVLPALCMCAANAITWALGWLATRLNTRRQLSAAQ